MNHDEDKLRDLLTRSAPTFVSLDGNAIRDSDGSLSSPRPPRRWRQGGLALGAAAIVVVSAIIASLILANRPSATQPVGADPASAFQIQLVLPTTRAPADGSPLHGYALAINHTGHTIEIRAGKCDPWLQAGLSGRHIRFEVTSILMGCASVQLREGTTRIPLTIPTTYTQCAQGNQSGTPDSPHCRGPNDNQMAALPPATYHAVVGTQHTSTTPRLPKPIVVMLQPVP